MKLIITKPTLLFFSAHSLFFAACTKQKPSTFVETPVQKSVEFRVFAVNDYSAPVYQNVKVDLRLQIVKTNYASGQQTVLWDTAFSTRKLTDFPNEITGLFSNKFIPYWSSRGN